MHNPFLKHCPAAQAIVKWWHQQAHGSVSAAKRSGRSLSHERSSTPVADQHCPEACFFKRNPSVISSYPTLLDRDSPSILYPLNLCRLGASSVTYFLVYRTNANNQGGDGIGKTTSSLARARERRAIELLTSHTNY